VLVDHEVADLPVHLLDGRACDVCVVRPLEVAPSGLTGPELEVRHVDVDDPVHQLEAVEAVVRARVVDDRQPETAVDSEWQRLEDLRDDVLGRDPVDVVTPNGLQLQHHPGKPSRAHALASHFPRDVVVLAEHAAEVAAAEEDGAGAPAAAETVLLAEVREVRRHDGVAPDRAEPLYVRATIHLATAGADHAALPEQLATRRGPLRQIAATSKLDVPG
jgi:hypothetical protein